MKPRPLSPHLQVYNLFFKINSLTSILHRATGAALVIGSLIIVWWLMAISHGPESYAKFITAAQSPLGKLILIGFTWAFWYQLINGIRHLFWDAGYGFKLNIAKLTGFISLFGSVLATILTWLRIEGIL